MCHSVRDRGKEGYTRMLLILLASACILWAKQSSSEILGRNLGSFNQHLMGRVRNHLFLFSPLKPLCKWLKSEIFIGNFQYIQNTVFKVTSFWSYWVWNYFSFPGANLLFKALLFTYFFPPGKVNKKKKSTKHHSKTPKVINWEFYSVLLNCSILVFIWESKNELWKVPSVLNKTEAIQLLDESCNRQVSHFIYGTIQKPEPRASSKVTTVLCVMKCIKPSCLSMKYE